MMSMMTWGSLPLLLLVFLAWQAVALVQRARASAARARAADAAVRKSTASLQGKVFQLADRLRGRLTVSDVVIATGLGVRQAEALLDGMVDGLRVRMEVSDSGLIQYDFAEISSRECRDSKPALEAAGRPAATLPREDERTTS